MKAYNLKNLLNHVPTGLFIFERVTVRNEDDERFSTSVELRGNETLNEVARIIEKAIEGHGAEDSLVVNVLNSDAELLYQLHWID